MKPVFILSLLLAAALPALAQPDPGPGVPPGMASRLAAEHIGIVEPGLYSTGDSNFVLESYGANKYLLRFLGSNERFLLTGARGSLGTRMLKYDTGATALRVSVWGGITLYTQASPAGLPATRQGDAPSRGPLEVSGQELQIAFTDETNHLTYVQRISIRFSTDPAVLQASPQTRGRAFDALTNAAQGIERFLASLPLARTLFAKRVTSVKVTEGGKPAVTLSGQTLQVSFVPGEGREGQASSLAIQQELGKLLAVSSKDVANK